MYKKEENKMNGRGIPPFAGLHLVPLGPESETVYKYKEKYIGHTGFFKNFQGLKPRIDQ